MRDGIVMYGIVKIEKCSLLKKSIRSLISYWFSFGIIKLYQHIQFGSKRYQDANVKL